MSCTYVKVKERTERATFQWAISRHGQLQQTQVQVQTVGRQRCNILTLISCMPVVCHNASESTAESTKGTLRWLRTKQVRKCTQSVTLLPWSAKWHLQMTPVASKLSGSTSGWAGVSDSVTSRRIPQYGCLVRWWFPKHEMCRQPQSQGNHERKVGWGLPTQYRVQ
jgi:hypothetical protein